ncbi:hypothetical protein AG4045_002222, partial [Apium graveolens]
FVINSYILMERFGRSQEVHTSSPKQTRDVIRMVTRSGHWRKVKWGRKIDIVLNNRRPVFHTRFNCL